MEDKDGSSCRRERKYNSVALIYLVISLCLCAFVAIRKINHKGSLRYTKVQEGIKRFSGRDVGWKIPTKL